MEARWIPGDWIQVDGWIVLCDISAMNDYHPYVTWFMRADDLTTHGGDYCRTLEEARESFARRLS